MNWIFNELFDVFWYQKVFKYSNGSEIATTRKSTEHTCVNLNEKLTNIFSISK